MEIQPRIFNHTFQLLKIRIIQTFRLEDPEENELAGDLPKDKYKASSLRQQNRPTNGKPQSKVEDLPSSKSPKRQFLDKITVYFTFPEFPAGVFQGMFYAPDRPKYLNYGSIGFTIGHEITHGFDDRGRQFDKIGELRNWWDEATKEKFLQRAKCIIDQYTGFTVKIRSDEDRSKYVDKNVSAVQEEVSLGPT